MSSGRVNHGAALESPTLAALYIRQGYRSRAATMLRSILAREPDNGFARALLERLARQETGRLALRYDEGQLQVRLDLPTLGGEDVSVVVTTWDRAGTQWVTSAVLRRSNETLSFPTDLAQGSACACVARLDAKRAFEVLLSAAPETW